MFHCFFGFEQDLFWIKRIVASPDPIHTLKSSFDDVGYISIKRRLSSCLFLFFILRQFLGTVGLDIYVFFFSNTVIQDQKGLPQELFAVKMYALTVDIPPKVHKTRSKTRGNRPQIIK